MREEHEAPPGAVEEAGMTPREDVCHFCGCRVLVVWNGVALVAKEFDGSLHRKHCAAMRREYRQRRRLHKRQRRAA